MQTKGANLKQKLPNQCEKNSSSIMPYQHLFKDQTPNLKKKTFPEHKDI